MKVGKENVYDRIGCSDDIIQQTIQPIWFSFFLQFSVLLLCYLVVAQCQDELPVVDEFNPFFFTGTYYLVSLVNLKTVNFVDSNVLIVMVVRQPLRFKWMSWMATIINWQNHYIIKRVSGYLKSGNIIIELCWHLDTVFTDVHESVCSWTYWGWMCPRKL